jgi:hypothetical protein
MKNTLLYNFLYKKSKSHFEIIKIFRYSYTERFNINGYDGFFMWHNNYHHETETFLLTLKKDDSVLTEFVEINNNCIKNTMNITNFNDNIVKSVSKEHISPKLLKTIEEKNDIHIISCGCCKRL